MDIFHVFRLFGGLALFLFGMDVMGKSLEKQAGSRLQIILEKLSGSPVRGFLLGLVVTAVIQSSSATTVMVVGFVNSGVMQLSRAIPVIMGSNVGTTVTSWLLSMTGIQGDSFLLQMLKPSSFSPVLAFIGILLYMGKKESRKDTGGIMLGFAILMTGMESMSASVAPLADETWFTSLFTLFQNPILGVIAGALLTAVIQSSSASVGILQALAATGAIRYASAVPIIMGQNIGTTVTAMLASVGANKNARRTALVHLYFNIIGATAFLLVFYGLEKTVGFAFLENAVTPVGIAMVHTTFNLLATALMLPFTKGLEKLAYLTLPDDQQAETYQLLDPLLLNTPSIAVEQSRMLAVEMANLARSGLLRALSLLSSWNESIADHILKEEDVLDQYEDALGSYLVKLSGHELTVSDSRQVSVLLHTIGDLERIGDHAVSIQKAAREMHLKGLGFSENAKQELSVLSHALQDVLDRTTESFATADVEAAGKVEPLEEVIDELTRQAKSRHIHRLTSGLCTIEHGFVLSDVLTCCERVADHCSNIAVAIIQVAQDSFDTHSYLNDLKMDDPHFKEQYEEFLAQYPMPEFTDRVRKD